MKLFPLLQLLDESIHSQSCKIHFASHNGLEDPLDVYLAGEFDHWQAWQTKKNFERDIMISLIALPEANRWLFAGIHEAGDCEWIEAKKLYRYSLNRRTTTNSLCGRLIVGFERPGRQSYLNAERWERLLKVAEIRPEPLQIADFLGYTKTVLTKPQLDIIVKQQLTTWKSALVSVAGVYVIADRLTGKLYIGSATGDEGIWGRWCAYAKTGHGGNIELRRLLNEQGSDYTANFQYGILETADSRATRKDILARELHWKQLLITQSHGYNKN